MVVGTSIPFNEQQHIVIDGVDWHFYEEVLEKIGDGPLRVTYCDGNIEIMAPLINTNSRGNISER